MNDNKLKIKGFIVWGICALFFLYEFFLRTVIGTYQYSIMQNLHLTSFQFSLLSSTVFLVVYGIMQIPVGIIVDNIGLKKALLLGVIFCTISTLGFASAENYLTALAFRMLMGLGASFGFVCLLVAVYDWMPHKYSALFIGLSQFIGTMGPMIAAGPLSSIISTTGISPRLIFLYLSGLGTILTLLVFFFVENNQHVAGKYVILYKSEKILTSLRRLFSKSQAWYIALFSACVYFTIEYLSENEGRAFLALKGISIDTASYMITFAWIGYAISCPLLGLISDLLERRTIIMKICACISLLAIIMILYSTSAHVIYSSFFLLGASAGGQSIGFAIIAEQFKKHFVAVGFGLNNTMITAISAVNAPVIGVMLDSISSGNVASLNNYLYVFNILIIFSCIGLIMAMFLIKETYCKSSADFTILGP